MEADCIEKVAVVGSGTMGHGIAEVCAIAGLEVGITDVKQEFLDNAMESISASLEKLEEKGKLTSSEREGALNRITTNLSTEIVVAPCQLAIEAVPEKMEIKQNVFHNIDQAIEETALIATNTSSLSVSDLSSEVSKPERFLGIHFFNPPVRMKLVEVIKGAKTEEAAVETAMDFSRRLGKEPVYCRKDSPGFIVNAILFPYLLEAVWLREEEGLNPEVMDSAVVEKLGFPMGPFELLDLVGLDVAKEIGEVIGWPIPPSVEDKVEIGHLGRKSKRGFYDYSAEGPSYSPEEGKDFNPVPLFAVMANESAGVLEEGVASAGDIDLAMELGAGLPEGPIKLAQQKGLQKMREGLEYLAELSSTAEGRYQAYGPLKEGYSEYGV